MARINFAIRDYSSELSTVSIPTADGTPRAALQAVIDAVTLGVIARYSIVEDAVAVSGAIPVSPYAQRELGLRIHVTDDVNGQTGYFTIAAPDLSALTVAGDEVVLADGGAMAALVTELESSARSRMGNAITVNRAEVVGRNN
jgi:hypothetical protein